MTNTLFSEFRLKDVQLRNRIAVPPMCQYMATDGFVNDWHLSHYAGLARGGAGLVIVEATGVLPEGRITPACLGLWSDDHIEGLAGVARQIRNAGAVPGIQIAHAGRKASAHRPWEGDDHIDPADPSAWTPRGPSAVAFGGGLPRVPEALSIEDIADVRTAFANAARRAAKAGFEWLELHFAHGYLAQSFFSPHANQRTDAYGGDEAGRGRFLLETLDDVREAWPENLPLTIRFGVAEYDGNDDVTTLESVRLIRQFREHGADFISVTLGFNTPMAEIPWGAGFMLPLAERVRQETGMPVATAWGLGAPRLADKGIRDEQIDLAMIGRAHLANPFWPLQAARTLGVERPEWVLPAPYAHWLERYHEVPDLSAEEVG
ncbi:NADH:flavin oxidoreductase/NADH oxidase [uncultured Thalassolituus sp.]|uniref:NADH:flavin oxidoreductase/NADH oxidase n=1 Tax=uncultured Thalassolituus sp. TaxID=285273 RepID=UPI0026314A7F|nr:NADH:flavin oxidoreductase/NADH oxidase [uncultured Thalassolituus sp.]